MKSTLFRKDFTLVVIGQIISLFGNNVLRYALPLYLLNETGSAALYGLVIALSFLPMLVLCPIGGLIADRVNKRNIMVVLDFSTAALMLLYSLVYPQLSLVPVLLATLMLLYGIQGAYQPTVQASIPALVAPEKLLAGNAVINMVNSLSGMLGPVLGGVAFGLWGINSVLLISIVCFFSSAVMEIFIHIPFEKQPSSGSVFKTALADMQESGSFIKTQRPEIGRTGLLLAAINLVFSALIIIGLPVVINEHLGFSQAQGNMLLGYAQGALALGGLIGALLSGSVGKLLDIQKSTILIFLCTLMLLPIGLTLMLSQWGMASYFVITGSYTLMMIFSTLLSIQLMTYVQRITPPNLIGKVMALLSCLVMCAHPIGQALYGVLFEAFSGCIHYIYFGAFVVCLALCLVSKHVFSSLDIEVLRPQKI